MTEFRSEPSEIEAPSAESVRSVVQSLALLGIEGASVALAGWSLRAGPLLSTHVLSNALPRSARMATLLDIGVGAALGMCVGALLLVYRRAGSEFVRRLSRRASPLALLWLLPPLWEYRVWKQRELAFLLLVALLLIAAQRLFAVAFESPPVFSNFRWPVRSSKIRRSVANSRALPLLIVIAASMGYAVFFSYFTIRNHYRLGTAAMDLGIEDNLLWNAMHWGPLFKASPLGGPDSTHAGFHQTYFSYVLVWAYRLAPRPETLLVLQSILMGAAAIPLYFVARQKLGRWTSCLLGLSYLLYAPLHGAALYDFHYLPLAVVFLWSTLYFMESGRYVWAAVAVLFTLSVREDISALLVIIGAYLVLTGERPLGGLIVSMVGAAYFVVIKFVVMPRFLGGTEAFIHQYVLLVPKSEHGFGGVLKTVLANPAFTMETLLERDKLVYALKIAVPFAFLPWRRPVGWLCTVPGFFFTLLETKYPPLIQTSFQYTTYWTTFLFIAVIANLHWLERRQFVEPARAQFWRAARGAWVAAFALGIVVTTHQFGAVLQQNTVIGGFGPYRFDLTEADRQRHDRLYKLIAQVPPDAKIVSSELIVPHVSSRKNSYTMRTGIYDAEYMLAWLPPRGDEASFIIDAIKSGTFGVVDVQGEFLLARRGYKTEKNAPLIARYHW